MAFSCPCRLDSSCVLVVPSDQLLSQGQGTVTTLVTSSPESQGFGLAPFSGAPRPPLTRKHPLSAALHVHMAPHSSDEHSAMLSRADVHYVIKYRAQTPTAGVDADRG